MGLFDATDAETPQTWTVTGLNRRIQSLLESEPDLKSVRLEAEISNYKKHSSGHIYFTLRDEESQISAVMWRSAAQRNPFQQFTDGDRVIARGALTVYAPRGQYQLQVERMQPAGVGELYKRMERLKAQLQAEGLFDEERKRPLPQRPRLVAIITSPTGAVIQDIIRTLRLKHARLKIWIFPTAVQGAEAITGIVQALGQIEKRIQQGANIEAVVIARGGGSLEDLWAFNEEQVVRAITRCSVPVISAVGHETDFTLSDFVADVRAATPTAAAALITPDLADELNTLAYYQESIVNSVSNQVRFHRQELDDIANTLSQQMQYFVSAQRQELQQNSIQIEYNVKSQIDKKGHHLKLAEALLKSAIVQKLELNRVKLDRLQGNMVSFNPASVLKRGFTLTYKNGVPVKKYTDLHVGNKVEIVFSDGRQQALITSDGTNLNG